MSRTRRSCSCTPASTHAHAHAHAVSTQHLIRGHERPWYGTRRRCCSPNTPSVTPSACTLAADLRKVGVETRALTHRPVGYTGCVEYEHHPAPHPASLRAHPLSVSSLRVERPSTQLAGGFEGSQSASLRILTDFLLLRRILLPLVEGERQHLLGTGGGLRTQVVPRRARAAPRTRS